MNRHLLSLALAAASLSAAPLAFAQDGHANASAREHASTQAMQQHMGTQDRAPATPATPAESAGVKKVTWSELDTNGDGNLSKSEAEPVDSLSGAFDSADADKDGMLTADEYKAYLASRQDSPTPDADDDN